MARIIANHELSWDSLNRLQRDPKLQLYPSGKGIVFITSRILFVIFIIPVDFVLIEILNFDFLFSLLIDMDPMRYEKLEKAEIETVEFPRIRIGIGPLPYGEDAVEYVLSCFDKIEGVLLEEGVKKASEALDMILDGRVDEAMNTYNQRGKTTAG